MTSASATKLCGILSFLLALTACGKKATTLSFSEDFSDPLQADSTATTGLWNAVDQRAQAGVVANSSTARPISFGDGSDGIVSSSNGYTFNTTTHSSGYNFVSLSITSGTITVTGSNPLIIRALKSVTISPAVTIDGGDGTAGSQTAVNTSGPAGGTARAGAGTGGAGGAVAAAAAAMNGGAGFDNTGVADAGTPGAGSSTVGTAGGFGTTAAGSPGADLDVTANFTGGAGGGGGGGHGAAADGIKATGGSGAAGGGMLKISAVGTITVGTLSARGGTGGNNATTTSKCSGAGAGGNGGAVWLQSLRALVAPTEPLYSGGSPGTASGAGCTTTLAALDGFARADSPSTPGTWVGGSNVYYSTSLAAASQTYIVQTKAYDLNVNNAGFKTNPTVSQTLNGGTITLSYAGSTDGTTYTSFGSSLTALNNTNVRYLKIKITIVTGGVAAASPYVDKISFDYEELSPPAEFTGSLGN